MHSGQVQTKEEIGRMVGGLRGFPVTDTKCQDRGMPQGRHQGVCVGQLNGKEDLVDSPKSNFSSATV